MCTFDDIKIEVKTCVKRTSMNIIQEPKLPNT